MKLNDQQQKFVHTWGTLGTNWGINKTMAQLHALLMISEKPLCTDEMMDMLTISRGNTNMNVRALVEWGLVSKEMISGDRKDFYSAKKDIWVVARQIAKQRRKRELEPVIAALVGLKKETENNQENKELLTRVNDIEDFAIKVDNMLEKFEKSDENWFYKVLLKLV
ncbi:MAG: DNA-binding transcriptional regulator GbsR (MarR family) [Bacteroidia bacterium]|jgi:DNA-binding transcriptional regulator GbsR (MarR family)|tara:strand:- start:459 stop:956 length:498 start_codon:yes stop_codon:yes gene_type:complete